MENETTGLGDQINMIAGVDTNDNAEPHVLRNVASYYRAKKEPWADGMARRLMVAANDNVAAPGRRVA